MSKIAQAHEIARMVLAMLRNNNASLAHRIVARCGIDTLELIENNANLVLRMRESEDAAMTALQGCRFWIFAARRNMVLIPLRDETPEEAINRKVMDDEWADQK